MARSRQRSIIDMGVWEAAESGASDNGQSGWRIVSIYPALLLLSPLCANPAMALPAGGLTNSQSNTLSHRQADLPLGVLITLDGNP